MAFTPQFAIEVGRGTEISLELNRYRGVFDSDHQERTLRFEISAEHSKYKESFQKHRLTSRWENDI